MYTPHYVWRNGCKSGLMSVEGPKYGESGLMSADLIEMI